MDQPDIDYDALISLRRELHRRPEVAGHEERTAAVVQGYLDQASPDEVVTGLGGHGVAAVFAGGAEGPTVLVRCDLDALPIEERLDVPYASEQPGVSHKCGHDGHMAIVTGLARWLSVRRPSRGRVVLLYQPAEETGAGARAVLDDPAFEALRPDVAFALHNLPGFSSGTVVVREGVFASASRGLVATLEGATSHAGQPERGVSPALAMAQLIEGLVALPQLHSAFDESALVTIVGARLGERAFGTSPGHAEVMATLRSHGDATMERLWSRAERLVTGLASGHGLTSRVEAVEDFPATVNDSGCVEAVASAARRAGAELERIDLPFPWSEDFGHFAASFPGTLFGLGAGGNHPALHAPDYDFPDALIPLGVHIFAAIVEEVLAS